MTSDNLVNLTVELAHKPNPDRGGYDLDPVDSGKASRVPVKDLAEASNVCQQFIERNYLGGGNWTGGKIRAGKVVIARVSYNGRVWDNDGKELLISN